MWSSCPWVRTSASMSSSRCSIARKSGRMRSTPGASSSGNNTPQSITSNRSACSKTVMLRPISPMPPRATARRPPSGSGGGAAVGTPGMGNGIPVGTALMPRPRRQLPLEPASRSRCYCLGRSRENPCLHECRGDRGDLVWLGRDLRQPGRTDVKAGQPQRRLTEGHPADRPEYTDQAQGAGMDTTGSAHIARLECGDHGSQPIGHDMAYDADEADCTYREPGQIEHVIPAVVGQTGTGDHLCAGTEIALG